MAAISIITSSLNALPLLKHTAESIFQQSSSDWEWIVIDGASIDGTHEWLEATRSLRSNIQFISEADHGIYDALNKALPLIKGEWVIFLGAGDTFFNPNTIENGGSILSRISPSVSIVYGSVLFLEGLQDTQGYLCDVLWNGVSGSWNAARPIIPCHQGVFQRAELFRSFKFDDRYRIAADGELLLRELIANRAVYIGLTITRMLRGGVSNDRVNRLALIREVIAINKKVGIFWERPLYQCLVLVSNLCKHPFRIIRKKFSL